MVVGAVALSHARSSFSADLSTADLPPGQAAAAHQIAEAGGPIAVNSLPLGTPGSAAHDLALHALGSGFNTAFLMCGTAAVIAAALAAFGMIGVHTRRSDENEEPTPLAYGRDGEPKTVFTP
ncbi:hypothetical protein OG564_00730 [Streptomyces sp. NBC_01280]|uniref:hypothetical protein n=1 Tax=unclassified Streptomyces TaxID=2593676 RepID=UPI002E2F0A06|nr:hypothetical protein [Streptomyces sp. NBC_01280]